MKQINNCLLSCSNLPVTDKFQNTRVLCLDFSLMVKKFVSPDNNNNNGNSNKKTQMNPLRK